MRAVPVVEEAVGRAGVEAGYAAFGWEQCHVGDAAEVDDHTVLGRIGQQRLVDQRGQRRALAAGGQVGPAQVGDHVDAGRGGDPGRVTDLQGVGECVVRAVQHGLTVAADSANAVVRCRL